MSEATLDPQSFYAHRIPRQFNEALEAQRQAGEAGDEAAAALHGSMAAVNTSVRVVVHGDGDELFHLNVDGGVMRAESAASHPALLTLSHHRACLDTLVRASGDSILGFLGGLVGLGDEMRLTPQRVENLGQLSGAFRFELTGDDGFELMVQLGPGEVMETPDASLVMDAEVYAQLSRGELKAQDAFFSGAIQIDGDMQLAVQLALAALAPDT
jgi:hypothetical protein